MIDTAAHETQDTVNQWAIETFGPEVPLVGLLAGLQEQVDALLDAVARLPVNTDAETTNAADVAIRACRVASRLRLAIEFGGHTPHAHQSPAAYADDIARELDCTRHAAKLLLRANPADADTLARAYANATKHLMAALMDLDALCVGLDTTLQSAVDAQMARHRDRASNLSGQSDPIKPGVLSKPC